MADSKIKKLIASKDFDSAIKELDKKLAKNKAPQDYVLKGNILARQEKAEEALKSYEEALKIDVREIGAYNGKALIYLCLKKTKKGVEEMEKGMIMANILEKNPGVSKEGASELFEELNNKKEIGLGKLGKKRSKKIKSIKPLGQKVEKETVSAEPEPAVSNQASFINRKSNFCTHCGARVQSGAKFCTKCGSRISS